MSAPSPDDAVTASTTVAVDPATAFDVFTQEVDAWWKQGPRFRTGAPGASTLHFEPRAGGRLLERFDDDERAEPFVLARITAWQPPERLLLEMFGRDFGPNDKTEVEILFEPFDTGTRVTIEHRGWDAFAADHPVRHGLVGDAFAAMMGLFWGDLLVALGDRSRER